MQKFRQYANFNILHVVENSGRYLPCTRRTVQGNNFELILAIKIKTRHLVEG